MNRQLYGVGNLVQREKFGIGSKLKKFVRNIIPNEVSEIAVKAAPFVAPFNPALAAAMSGIGGFDQTGRIGSSLKNAALVYGAGQLARGIGGAGFQGNPFTGVDFSGGFTSGIQSLFTSPMGNLPFGSFSTPTQNLIQTSPGYTGGADALTYDPTTGQQLGRTAEELQKGQLLQSAKELETGMGRSQAELIKEYGTQPGTQPGYVDLIQKAGSLDSNVSLTERFNAIKDLGGKALKDIYTNPVRNAAGEIVSYDYDKKAVIATISGAASYYEAKKLADEAGLDDTEFNEEIYQQTKVAPYKTTFSERLKPESFGITKAKNGGRIGYAEGSIPTEGVLSITLTPTNRENFQVGGMKKDMSNNRISQIIQLIRDAEAMGNIEKAEELRLDLFRETKKANGGQITGRNNYLLGSIVKAVGVAEPTSGAKPLGLVFNMNEGGGGIGNLIKRVLQQVQPQQPRSVSNAPVNDLYKYYLENSTDEDYKKRIMESIQPRFGIAMGGEIPVKQNAAGVSELDMRAKGGFIPVGIKEKADDVPAMLSKNEFVFTADAVRGAGKGSINKGAQKMYKLMKSLEKKVKKQR
jgi:hypothetical protein